MTKQQARRLQQQWSNVAFYVTAKRKGSDVIVGPGFSNFYVAQIWQNTCQLFFNKTSLTFIAKNLVAEQQPKILRA